MDKKKTSAKKTPAKKKTAKKKEPKEKKTTKKKKEAKAEKEAAAGAEKDDSVQPSINIGLVGHVMMESGVEHGRLGNAGQEPFARLNALEVVRVVQGRELGEVADGGLHLVVHGH